MADTDTWKHPYINKEFRHLILKFIILNKISCGKTYSYSLIKDIKDIGSPKFTIRDKSAVKNDVYNTISSLERAGLIKSTDKLESGRRKKYYKLTKKGSTTLKEARKILAPMVKELRNSLKNTLG